MTCCVSGGKWLGLLATETATFDVATNCKRATHFHLGQGSITAHEDLEVLLELDYHVSCVCVEGQVTVGVESPAAPAEQAADLPFASIPDTVAGSGSSTAAEAPAPPPAPAAPPAAGAAANLSSAARFFISADVLFLVLARSPMPRFGPRAAGDDGLGVDAGLLQSNSTSPASARRAR